MTVDDTDRQLQAINREALERWRWAMANGDEALVAEMVSTSHDARDARRRLRSDKLPRPALTMLAAS